MTQCQHCGKNAIEMKRSVRWIVLGEGRGSYVCDLCVEKLARERWAQLEASHG